ncbi:MAG: acyl--CoA ligase [Verrucomicrobiota bacterium]|nr:acyl--CoA ligase [Verrucomicrobiota bacterium]
MIDDALIAAWRRILLENGTRAAILDGKGEVVRTFAQVEERAAFFEEKLALAPRAVIAIQIGNHPDWPALFLACLRRQLVTLPLEQTIGERERVNALAITQASALVTAGGEKIEQIGSAMIDWGERRPVLLKLTSGTTAAPRAIRFRGEQLVADCENICDTMEIRQRDLNYGVIPISHSYGFSNLLTPLLVRGVALALSADRMPRAILDGMAATRATVFPGMPVFYQSFCKMEERPDLPDLRLCISAGAPLTLELAARFRERFGRTIHSFYGSSECGGICYVRAPRDEPGYVGAAMKGVAIEQSASSKIRVRSDAVGDGYFPEPDAERLGGGVFEPDDLLEKTPHGYRITGRGSDLINVAGKKVNPTEVEAELRKCASVREAIVFGRASERRNQEIAACVVSDGKVTEAELLAHCRERLSGWQVPRRIYLVDAIPANERGKISRRDLARKYSA